jgi:predicted PurR-regulated permease PerM
LVFAATDFREIYHAITVKEELVEFIRAVRERHFPLVISDPQPVAKVETIWSAAAQVATIGIFLIVLIAAIEYGRPILLPTMSAFVLGMMLGPLSNRATKIGIPSLASALFLWLLVVAVFYGIIILLSAPLVDWAGKAPQIGQSIKDKLHVLDRPLSALQDIRNALLPNANDKGVTLDLVSIVQPALTVVTPAIGQIFIFFGTLFFFLLGRNQLRHVLVAFFDERDARLRMLRILNDIENNLTSYLSVVAIINFVVGVSAGLIAFFVGLPNPVAWAVLAFILNFIPYLGAIIMEVVLLAVGLVTFPDLGHAMIAPLLYLAFTTIEGHFITPSIMGKRLLLNPLTVFLALIFWTWLWGPVGAFLAVPIVIVTLVAVNHLFPKDEAVLPG